MKKYMSLLICGLISYSVFAQDVPLSDDELLLQALENPLLSHMSRDPQPQLLIQIEAQMSQGPMGKGQISFTRKTSGQQTGETFIGVQKHTVLVHIGSGPYC